MKRFFKKLLANTPTALPIGVAEFEAWAADIVFIYQLPDNASIRFALASQILHCNPNSSKQSKKYFGETMLKGASSEIAGYIMRTLKEEQAAKAVAEKAASEQAAVVQTTSTVV